MVLVSFDADIYFFLTDFILIYNEFVWAGIRRIYLAFQKLIGEFFFVSGVLYVCFCLETQEKKPNSNSTFFSLSQIYVSQKMQRNEKSDAAICDTNQNVSH